MGSTRFPGKPLCDLVGKPMVQWVYEAAVSSGAADEVVVATPDQAIADACASFGAQAIITAHSHQTGTDRISEVASKVKADVYVNVQGDEPLIRPESIRACAQPLLDSDAVQLASVYSECADSELDDPNVVKVVTDRDSLALYFSRYPIPFARQLRATPVKKHVGLYSYRREPLLHFPLWEMGLLERAESLEQLRFMENGLRIFMTKAEGTELAIDTPEQAEIVRRILSQR
jgi:3-deoxy-D-manno-octulosonate cytidylyltransferase